MEKIICPHCSKEVELSEALFHEVEAKISKELSAKQKEELEKVKEQTLLEAKKKLEEEVSFKLKNSENESKELKERNKELTEQMLELSKQMRLKDEQVRKDQLESERRLTETIQKVQKEITDSLDEKYRLQIAEKEKQLEDTKKLLAEAQKKSDQKSQQLQGEVLELDLETQLINSFPDDQIKEVPKGIRGADVLQLVRNKQGREAGTILWEAKRARWNQNWLAKLKEDMRTAGSSEAVLVVEELPEKVRNGGLVSGVWVTSYKDALTVAQTLRLLLMKVAAAKSASENKDERLEELYQYITSDNFRHRIESQIESFIQMKNDLDSEKRSMERLWAKREIQLNRLEKNTTNIFGELQGIAGDKLPTIRSLGAGEADAQEDLFAEISQDN